MQERNKALLLSVRPPFAKAILSGTKTAEVRRQRPSVALGALVIIYATKPIGAIVGTARISEISSGGAEEMWQDHSVKVGISREEFDDYLDGANSAYILEITKVQHLVPLLTLEQMRAAADFQPPQGYRYINESMLNTLVGDHPQCSSLLAALRRPITV
jgi:predicted transcriptional regulator